MNENEKPTCDTCRFFVSGGSTGERWGACYRHPPVVFARVYTSTLNGDTDVIESAHRPETHSSDFCGEWARRP